MAALWPVTMRLWDSRFMRTGPSSIPLFLATKQPGISTVNHQGISEEHDAPPFPLLPLEERGLIMARAIYLGTLESKVPPRSIKDDTRPDDLSRHHLFVCLTNILKPELV